MSFWKWSRIAANNATADSTCPFPEGMAPSAVNDGARGMMAAAAKYRDDIAGAIVTTGTSTAYVVSSYQGFGSLADLNGQMIAFTPHTTNTSGEVFLNADGLGAKPLRQQPGLALPAGVLIQGTPYAVTYNHADGAFYLHGLFGNPYNVPLAAGMDYWASTTPNSSFAFPVGQPISRSTYSALFALIGTAFGGGDGSTTFNLPDKRGRVSAMIDAAGARLTGTHFPNAGSIGTVGGSDGKALATANLPPYTPSGSVSSSGTVTLNIGTTLQGAGAAFADIIEQVGSGASPHTLSISSSFAGNAQGGTSTPIPLVQPTIVCNYIIRVL